jgi:hypothetical protein
MSAVHPHGKSNTVAKMAALVCFAIAAVLLIASLATSPARANKNFAQPALVSSTTR